MELDHEFTLTADPETAWRALLDVPRMAPLMPGVSLESSDGDAHTGRVRLKFGAATITLRGSVETLVIDDLTRTAILRATAREARGPGTAEATFQATVHPAPEGARVTVHTRAELTGRAGDVPRPVLETTAARLLARFAAALDSDLTAPTTRPKAEVPMPEPTPEPGEAVAPAPEPIESEVPADAVDPEAAEAEAVAHVPAEPEDKPVDEAFPTDDDRLVAGPIVWNDDVVDPGGRIGGGLDGAGLVELARKALLPLTAAVLAVLAARLITRRLRR